MCQRNLGIQWGLFFSTLFLQSGYSLPRPPNGPAPPPPPPKRKPVVVDERGFYGPPLGDMFGTGNDRKQEAVGGRRK
jgi:hypothetical protein